MHQITSPRAEKLSRINEELFLGFSFSATKVSWLLRQGGDFWLAL